MLLIASLVCLLAACDEAPTSATAPIDQEFVLAPGQSSVVEEIDVRFIRVAADSRCPADVVCVSAGDAQVQIMVTSEAQSREYELHTRDKSPVAHDGYAINLMKVEPYPYSSKKIEPDDYRVTLKVTK
jgi:hypothetical protein